VQAWVDSRSRNARKRHKVMLLHFRMRHYHLIWEGREGAGVYSLSKSIICKILKCVVERERERETEE